MQALRRIPATACRHNSVRCVSLTPQSFVRFSSSSSTLATSPLDADYSSQDGVFEDQLARNIDGADARTSQYLLLGATKTLYASAARLAVVKFVAALAPSADVLALGSAEVDVGAIAEGKTLTIKWRGKPVFIRHRTSKETESAVAADSADLRDPATDSTRRQIPNILVVLGICTHLGCVPLSNAGDYGGWFCPCHGSHYDTSGRIRKGPAPLNLEVPPYKFLDARTLVIGA